MQVKVDCGELYDTHEVENQIVWDVMYGWTVNMNRQFWYY